MLDDVVGNELTVSIGWNTAPWQMCWRGNQAISSAAMTGADASVK